MSLKVIVADIVKMRVDCIVNAANSELLKGGGVCGAIFEKAGSEELTLACKDLSPVKTGHCVITPGFNCNCEFIIHCVGPVYKDGLSGEEKLLYSCYEESLKLARSKGAHSIAFPLISSGIYGFPKVSSFHIAEKAIIEHMRGMEVYLVIYSQNDFELLGLSS